jgi:hypothetical protein
MRIIKRPGTEPEPQLEISLEDADNGVIIYATRAGSNAHHPIVAITEAGLSVYGIPKGLGIKTLECAFPATRFVRTAYNTIADEATIMRRES